MRIRHRRALPAVVLALLVVACGSSRADFATGTLADIERSLERSGLEVCSRLTNTAGLANQATKTTVWNVGVDCHEELVTVVIDRFATETDRDAAARALEVQTRPRRDGVVWTFGPQTVAVFGPRDHQVMQKVTRALDRIDAR